MKKPKDASGVYRNLVNQFNRIFTESLRDGSVSSQTQFRYRSSFNVFMRFCAERYRLQKLGKVRDRFVTEFIAWRKGQGISLDTIRRDVVAIRHFHARNETAEFRLRPLEDYDLARTNRTYIQRGWHEDEFAGICAKAAALGRQEVLLAVRLAWYTGLRIHECVRLNTCDVKDSLRTGEITVKGKGGKVRSVPVSPEAREILITAAAVAGELGLTKLFVPEGRQAHQVIKSIESFVARHRGHAMTGDREKPITFHGLRHRYAQDERARGKSLPEVSRLLGHEREDITKVYVKQ
ncbi:MAG: tyrosine-type recombinase/integrase [Peptococcaceae bacterium]|nr:tyrosine-type recombinase/integrase [Peptococcaceae bacterium]